MFTIAGRGPFAPLPTNPVWWGSMHAISSYRGNRPTPPVPPGRPPVCHRQGRLQYSAPQLRPQYKKRSESRKHCVLAVVRPLLCDDIQWIRTTKSWDKSTKISPRRRPPFWPARDSQNLISWRWSVTNFTCKPIWWGSMHAISSYRGNRPTNTHTHTHKQTGAITIYCAAASLARSVISLDLSSLSGEISVEHVISLCGI